MPPPTPGGGTGCGIGLLSGESGPASGSGSHFLSATGGKSPLKPLPTAGPTGWPPTVIGPAAPRSELSHSRRLIASVRALIWSAAFFWAHAGRGPSPTVTLLYCLIVPFANSKVARALL